AARRGDRAAALADALAIDAVEPCAVTALDDTRYDAIVNATPVGMTGGPDPATSPLPATVPVDDGVTVLDTVYTPPITPLLEDAATRGAAIVTGEDMFVRQAAAQCSRWTGHADPLPLYRAALSA
ncbi:MAG: shikimate dehydrogenase, partial [Phycisphaerales bacterium]|nr:shikimate dehydrogenase [Phycisphaerales bacterium]